VRGGEPQVYVALAGIRNAYLQVQWVRVQMLVVFNSITIPLVFGLGPKFAGSEVAAIVISLAAFYFHFYIRTAVKMTVNWVDFFDARLKDLENLDSGSDAGVRVQVFTHPDFALKRSSPFTNARLLDILLAALMLFWFGELIYHVYLFLEAGPRH
jgi:hypothetical protein